MLKKVTFTLKQNMKAERKSRGIVYSFFNLCVRWGGESGWSRSLPPPGRNPGLIVQEGRWPPGPVWTGAENLIFTGIRSPDRPINYILHIKMHLVSDITSWAGIAQPV